MMKCEDLDCMCCYPHWCAFPKVYAEGVQYLCKECKQKWSSVLSTEENTRSKTAWKYIEAMNEPHYHWRGIPPTIYYAT